MTDRNSDVPQNAPQNVPQDAPGHGTGADANRPVVDGLRRGGKLAGQAGARISTASGHLGGWLDDRGSRTRVFYVLAGVCVLLLLIDLVHDRHGYVPIEEVPGFYAVYAALVSVAFVFAARGLRRVLGKPAGYYGDGQDDAYDDSHDGGPGGRTAQRGPDA